MQSVQAEPKPVLVSEEQARTADPIVPAPSALAIAEANNNHAVTVQRTSLGLIGKFLGAGSEKAGNVAAIVILFSFCAVAVAFFYGGDGGKQRLDDAFFKVLSAFSGLIGLALGYLFGSSSDKK